MGRLIEVLRRAPFDQVLADYLFKPLGMKHAFAGPTAIDLIVAIGHISSTFEKGVWYDSEVPYLSMGQAAAGSVATMSADLLRFAQMHLSGGQSPKAIRILSRKSVKAMQARELRLPKHLAVA